MTPLLLPARCLSTPAPPTGTVQVRVLLSPLRGADGSLRWRDQSRCAGASLADVLPAGGAWDRVVVNGRVVPPEEWERLIVAEGDEVLCIPHWGLVEAGVLTVWGYLAVGLATTAVSVGLSMLQRFVLFPPKSPTIRDSFEADEPTYSFTGIRTAQGPGAMVPVVYGRHRLGGQLLAASVEHAVTVVHEGSNVYAQTVQAQGASPTLTMLIALCEGPIQAIDTNSIELNGQPITNFPGVNIFTRLGTVDQTPIPEFGETRNTYDVGIEITTTPLVYTTTITADVQAFVLNIGFLQGLYVMTERGDKVLNIVSVGYRYRIHAPQGPWIEGPIGGLFVTTITGERTTAVRAAIRRQGLAADRYDIEVRLTYASNMDETRAAWRPTLESVTEIQHNVQSYPQTALLGLQAVATDQLQGSIPNITVEVQGRIVRVGSFAAPETWSDNPAWCVMDLLTNTRYGFGYSDSQIDLASFTTWAAYCAEIFAGETRHVLNYVLDREVRGQEGLLEIMGGSRTLLVKVGNTWHARPSRNDAPVQLISAANCTNVRISYTRDVDRINVMEARFANEDLKYAQDVQTWPVMDQWPAVMRKASLEIRGVTKPSRIQRALQFELNRRRLEKLRLEFEASLDALVLLPHDVFRFSHPLPGWGASGRLLEGSTATTLLLDHAVTFILGRTYHIYLRFHNATVQVRDVWNPGNITTDRISVTVPLVWGTELPRQTLWALGESGPVDTAQRAFRVIKMERTGEQTVRIQAILHHPGIYDEPVAQPLPPTTELFNPLGPPPPLLSLVATELMRIQSSGASLIVVNLAWDVAPLSSGYAPYGGAQIYRRTVDSNALAGVAQAGVVALGQSQSVADGTGNFVPIARVSGQVLELDDYTVMPGVTYLYRVVPVSGRGVPNLVGAREVLIHVAGPTTGPYFPGTPLNLRLAGQVPGYRYFEGRDIHLEWDAVPPSPLFTDTFYIADYIVEAWAPGQAYLLRRTSVPAAGQATLRFTYTYDMNVEDSARAGQPGPRRILLFVVYARTNTNRVSLTPASLEVENPPPDMSMIEPDVTPLFEAAIIEWTQWVEPRDFSHYVIYLDTVTPPLAIYQDVPGNFQKIAPMGLQANVPYYVRILPSDTFGPGLPTVISTFTPVALNGGQLDTTPPSVPTNLVLTTGTTVSADGTIITWVQATWTASPEPDVAGYQVNWYVGASEVPTVQTTGVETTARVENVPGNVTIRCKVAAFDRFRNISTFSLEASLTTGTDTQAPAAITYATCFAGLQTNILSWSPPADLDYVYGDVYGSLTNDLQTAAWVGSGYNTVSHSGLTTATTWYYWFYAVDSSGNASPPYPTGPTSDIQGTPIPIGEGDVDNGVITETKIADDAISTPKLQANSVTAEEIAANVIDSGHLRTDTLVVTTAAQIQNAIIQDAHISTLSATKITAGTLQALVRIGVGDGAINLDGPQHQVVVWDMQDPAQFRVILGKLGALSTNYGLLVVDHLGRVMFNADDGGVTANGIKAGIIEAGHIRTDVAVIRVAAQIENALIDYAHIKDAAIRTAHIDDAQVTSAKIATITADQITTGTLTGQGIFLAGGVGGSVFLLDGNHQHIYMTDGTRTRLILGRFSNASPDFGLWIWNAAGDLMWDFNSGALTPGIGDAAVETPKVAPEAITEGISWFEDTGTSVADTPVFLGSINLGDLATNDQVWISGQVIVDMTGAIDCYLYLHIGGGFVWHSRSTVQAIHTLGVQYVLTAPFPMSNVTVGLWASTNGPSTFSWKSIVALHRKR